MRNLVIVLAMLILELAPALVHAQFGREDFKDEQERVGRTRSSVEKSEKSLTAGLASRDLERIASAAGSIRYTAEQLEPIDPHRADDAIRYAKDAETLLELDKTKQDILFTAYDRSMEAGLVARKGQFQRCRDLLAESLSVFDEVYGRHSYSSCRLIETLRASAISTGTKEEGDKMSLAVMERYAQIFGKQDPRYWEAATVRAYFLARDGNAAEAEQLANDGLKFRTAIFGQYDGAVAQSWSALASAYIAQGKVKEAREALTKCTEVLEGSRTKATETFELTLLEVTARIERGEKQFDKAAASYEKLVVKTERSAPPNHPFLIEQYEALADIYRELGRDADASNLRGKAKAIRDTLTAQRADTTNTRQPSM